MERMTVQGVVTPKNNFTEKVFEFSSIFHDDLILLEYLRYLNKNFKDVKILYADIENDNSVVRFAWEKQIFTGTPEQFAELLQIARLSLRGEEL